MEVWSQATANVAEVIMNPPTELPMNPNSIAPALARIHRVSRVIRLLCRLNYLLIALMVAGLIVPILMQKGAAADAGQTEGDSPWARVLLIGAIGAGMVGSTVVVDRLFACFQRGEIFERTTLRNFRILSWIILATGLIKLDFSMGQQFSVRCSLISGQFWVGVLLIFISWVLEIGAEIQEENHGTV